MSLQSLLSLTLRKACCHSETGDGALFGVCQLDSLPLFWSWTKPHVALAGDFDWRRFFVFVSHVSRLRGDFPLPRMKAVDDTQPCRNYVGVFTKHSGRVVLSADCYS